MITTLRAALSVLMLLGFYVLALALVGGLGYGAYLLFQEDAGSAAIKVGFLTVAVAVGIIAALGKVIFAKPAKPEGLVVTPAQTPYLWQVVHELAVAANTAPPAEIRLIPAINAAVTEDARLLGLIAGTRRLYLGVPLLQGLTIAQLRSVVAHELGHYSRNHTRLGQIAYRGRIAVVGTVQAVGGLAGALLTPYAKLYMLVEAAVSRRQELEADRLSVQAAGRRVAQSALRELPLLDAAWGFYETRYMDPGWEVGYAPTPADFFGGFRHLLWARSGELAALRGTSPAAKHNRWDSHPPIAARIAAMDAIPDVAAPDDPRSATELVPYFDQAAAALAAQSVRFGDRQQLPWDQLGAVTAQIQQQRVADELYRMVARIAGAPEANLGTVLWLVNAGRVGELAAAAKSDSGFADEMQVLLRVATVRAGAARWQLSWSSAPVLLGRDGAPLQVQVLASDAVNPATTGSVTAFLGQIGVDINAAAQVDRVATAHGGTITGGLANVKVNDNPYDLLILDIGLIMIPAPKETQGGKSRLIELGRSAPLAELAQRHEFVPFEEVASAVIEKRTPVRVTMTLHDGRTLVIHEPWSTDRLTRDSDDALTGPLAAFVRTPAPSA